MKYYRVMIEEGENARRKMGGPYVLYNFPLGGIIFIVKRT